MGERITLTLERYAAQGRAVARVAGKAVFVERGIAGEEVEAELLREEARHATARVTGVLRASPDRVSPACPHFEQCGGCDWQHVRYPAQVALKRQVAQEQLERIGKVPVPEDWEVTPAAQPLEYRDKLEWVPVLGADGWRAGIHGRDGAPPLAIDRCWLAPPEFTRLARQALATLAATGEAAGSRTEAPPFGVTRLTVQGGQDAAGAPVLGLTLHVRHARELEPLTAQGSRLLGALRREFPTLTVVAVAAGSDEERPGSLRVAAGDGVLYKTVGAFRFPVPIGAFFQVHPVQAELLSRYVVEQITQHLPPGQAPGARLFDLFCGAGLFALPLLAQGYGVTGAEASRAAVQAAQRAATAAGLTGGRFQVADLDRPQALRNLIRAHGHPQGVVVDPPRRGLSARLAADLAAAAPPLLVYVSCDPGTFARDAARLAGRYRLADLRGFDFFPQTHHLELVGTFRLVP